MYSEITIAKQVEARLNRRVLLVADGTLWLFFLWVFKFTSFARFEGLAVLVALIWTGGLALHFLGLAYVELRDYLVQRAIEQERRTYAVEKPKRRPISHDDLIADDFPETAELLKIKRS